MDAIPFHIVLATAGQRPQLLETTLHSLSSAAKPAGYAGLWLIENGPTAEAATLAGQFEAALGCRYRHCPEPNKSRALNVALDEIDAGLIFFVDDDVRLAEEALLAYADAAGHFGRGHFFGGPTAAAYEGSPPPWLIRFLPPSARGLSHPPRTVRPLRWKQSPFLGFNWAAFSEDIRIAGRFDPAVGPGSPTGARGQETDMQQRLHRAGCRPVYVPSACAWHHVPQAHCTTDWLLQRSYHHGLTEGVKARQAPNRLRQSYKLLRALTVQRVLQSLRPLAYLTQGRSVRRFAAHHHRRRCEGILAGYRAAYEQPGGAAASIQSPAAADDAARQ